MSLEELRAAEEVVREKLEAVRAQLAAVTATVRDAARAEHELAAIHDRQKGSEGVYRDAAAERLLDLRTRIDAEKIAAPQRERLRREEARLLVDLERARLDIERAGVRRSVLPVLEDLPRATPCSARWDEMAGDGDARTCPRCKLTVFNVAMLEADDAAKLLAAAGGDASLHRRADGTILARDCPTGVGRQRFSRLAAVVVLALSLVALAALGYTRLGSTVGGAGHGDPSVFEADWPPTPPAERLAHDEPAPPPPLQLRNASALRITDSFDTLGGRYTLDAALTRSGNEFSVSLECAKFQARQTRKGAVPVTVVESFLAAVSGHRPSPRTPVSLCTHTDDYPNITVAVTTPLASTELSVKNCSRQWFVGNVPLDPDVPPASRNHDKINEGYRQLLDAMAVPQCFKDVEARRTN